jgi:hypothetical protein
MADTLLHQQRTQTATIRRHLGAFRDSAPMRIKIKPKQTEPAILIRQQHRPRTTRHATSNRTRP